MKRILLLLLLAFPIAALAEPLTVAVSILPQKRFVEKLVGEEVRVIVMVGPGQSPATYEPTPKQMAALSGAELYFSTGLPFERIWLPRIRQACDGLQVVDATRGIPRREMAGHHGHDHGGERDPHLWTDPRLVARSLPALAEALAAANPANADRYRAKAVAFAAELEALHQELAELLAVAEGKSFLVFHPSWGYFAEAYGLRQLPIEIEGKTPGARSLAETIDRARAEGVTAIFVQRQFAGGAARAVAEAIDARLIQVDPLAEDYCENLRGTARAFAEALR
jgi:zinc transport system substrate-binding protein